MATVLILGGFDDDHAVFMHGYLQDRGVDVELVDSRWFPAHARIAHDPVSGSWALRLPAGRSLDVRDIRSIYWRCYNGVTRAELPDVEQSYVAGNDTRSLFESLLIGLPVRWVNGWNGYQLHQSKPAALARVAALGVPVPATYLGNDPEALRAFATRYPRCIFKPVQGGAHARPLSPSHLSDANLENLALAPVTVQEEVPGTNIRAFVAGNRVLACEVRTDTLDYRDTAGPRILVHELPDGVAERCLDIATVLELRWTGIDFRLTPEGRYVFLEANPSPMFRGFESRCGLPLTESLAALLTE